MTDEEKIIARILDVIPPGSFELTTFLSLFRVRFSEKTKTACVTCGEIRSYIPSVSLPFTPKIVLKSNTPELSLSTRTSSRPIARRTNTSSCS